MGRDLHFLPCVLRKFNSYFKLGGYPFKRQVDSISKELRGDYT